MNNPTNLYKIQHPNRTQVQFEMNALDDIIPQNHRARDIWEFVQGMNCNPCFDNLKTLINSSGRPATSPVVLLALWIYSIMDGNSSARKLEELCKNHNAYKWIAGGLIAKVNAKLTKLGVPTAKYWQGDCAYSSKDDVELIAKLYPSLTYYAPPKVRKGIDPKRHLKSDSSAVKAWRDLIGDEEITRQYSKRCSTVEFANAQVKNRGFWKLMVRGYEKVLGASLLQAIVYNIERYIDLVRPKACV